MTDGPALHLAISAIVPVFNKAALFRQCAESIVAAAEQSGVEVIFVDHGSTDGAGEIARSFAGTVVVDHRGGTVASVRNAGARRARGTILCFLDSDVTIPADYFERVSAAFRRTGAGAVGYECDIPADAGWLEASWHALSAVPGEGARWYINAANIAVTRNAFDAVGGWDERLISAEEVDLCRRLRLASFQVWAAPELRAVHLDNPKTLGGFFRKQLWHGKGVPASDGRLVPNKVMAMAAVHLALAIGGLAVLFAPGFPPGWRIGLASGALLVVPGLAWAYRTAQTRRWSNPVAALVLFQAYFGARAVALIGIVLGRVRGHK